jgi:hypothetical protein
MVLQLKPQRFFTEAFAFFWEGLSLQDKQRSSGICGWAAAARAPQRDLAPQTRAPILLSFCSFVEIL